MEKRSSVACKILPDFCVCIKCGKAAEKPLTLPCYHTLCDGCYSEVRDGGKYICPKCGCFTFSSKPSPTGDFVKSFLQIFGGSKPLHTCFMCEEDGKTVDALMTCLNCPGETNQFCRRCVKMHDRLLPNHFMVSVEEYIEMGGQIVTVSKKHCAAHRSREAEAVCKSCEVPLCISCVSLGNCTQGKEWHTRHVAEGKEERADRLKGKVRGARRECEVNIQSLEGPIMAAETAVATVLSRREECIEEMKKYTCLVNTMMDSAREELRKLEESMRQSWDQNADICQAELIRLNKTREENKKGVRIADRCLSHAPNEEVEGLLSEVLNHQTAPTQNFPTLTSVTFSGPDKTEMKCLLGKIVGTLTTESLSVLHPVICHTTFSSDACPFETIRVKVGSSMCLLEVRELEGLHITGCDDQRKGPMYRREKGGYNCAGVSKDGKYLYCCYEDSAFHTYTCEDDGSLKFRSEQQVAGSDDLHGMCVISDDVLAAVDYYGDAILLLSRGGGVLQSVQDAVKGTMCVGSPLYITSSSDGKLIYITNEGNCNVSPSVACIDITNESVKWLTELDDPWNIHLIGRCLYITHRYETQVTVLDLVDGSKVKVIECPGKARCVFEDSYGKVTIVSYQEIG